jgi:hypothetical protein
MAEAARIVEGMGADIVDVNMGCPVPKIAATLQPDARAAHAAEVVRAMVQAVRILVTVKMRAGWNEHEINAPQLAEDAPAWAVCRAWPDGGAVVHRRGLSLIGRVAERVDDSVFGSGLCRGQSRRLARWGVRGTVPVNRAPSAIRGSFGKRRRPRAAGAPMATPKRRGGFCSLSRAALLTSAASAGSAHRPARRGACRAAAAALGHQQASGLGSWPTKGHLDRTCACLSLGQSIRNSADVENFF